MAPLLRRVGLLACPRAERAPSARGQARRPTLRSNRNLLGTLALVSVAFLAHAEIIDRIAVSVGNRVITTTDLEREIRVTAFLNGTKPEFTKASREATADRMVEQMLIRIELEHSRYRKPDPAEIQPVLDKFKQDHYKDDEEFRAALARYGITEQEVKDELLWQRSVLLFVNARFRPAVEVTDKDIEEYFQKEVAPVVRTSSGGRPATLDEFRGVIEETLTGRRVDEQMNQWLAETRRRTRVQIRPEVFK